VAARPRAVGDRPHRDHRALTARSRPAGARRHNDLSSGDRPNFDAAAGAFPPPREVMRIVRQAGFTLIELLLVVVILGILAAVAIPQLADSSLEARTSTLQTNLAVLRNAVEYYRSNHLGKYPGYPVGGGAPTQVLANDQLVLASRADGSTAAPGTAGYGFGPYIRERVPENPINGLNTIQIVPDGSPFPAAADNATGWIYQPQLGKIRANSTGTAPSGRNYYDF
jgi:prepilin-type N-terminal cleavage/methylation domain-containing protein